MAFVLDRDRARTLRRTWQVVALLRSCGGVSLAKLAAETGVCERTIRRDLQTLESAGVPLYVVTTDAGNKRWRLVRGAPCVVCGTVRQSAGGHS